MIAHRAETCGSLYNWVTLVLCVTGLVHMIVDTNFNVLS